MFEKLLKKGKNKIVEKCIKDLNDNGKKEALITRISIKYLPKEKGLIPIVQLMVFCSNFYG